MFNKKGLRKLYITMLAVALVFTVGTANLKADETNDKLKVWIKGSYIVSDVDPVIKNGRTQVPIRFVSSELGYDVKWNGENQTIDITDGKTNIQLTVDSEIAKFNNEQKTLDNKVFIENNRTFVPLRFITEAFNENVDWDNETRTAVVGVEFNNKKQYPTKDYTKNIEENTKNDETKQTQADSNVVEDKSNTTKVLIPADKIDETLAQIRRLEENIIKEITTQGFVAEIGETDRKLQEDLFRYLFVDNKDLRSYAKEGRYQIYNQNEEYGKQMNLGRKAVDFRLFFGVEKIDNISELYTPELQKKMVQKIINKGKKVGDGYNIIDKNKQKCVFTIRFHKTLKHSLELIYTLKMYL